MPKRITAIGFILIILAGNGWLVFALLGGEQPMWVRLTFFMGMVTACVGGLCLLVNKVWPGHDELPGESGD